jgi:hypothetical protein
MMKKRNHHFDLVNKLKIKNEFKIPLLFLESGGIYDMSDEKVMDDMKQEVRTRMQSLLVPTPKVASEFYTAAEMVNKIRNLLREDHLFFLGTIQKTKKGN